MPRRQTASPAEPEFDTASPSDAAIAERAYALFEARGREPGRDQEDWLQAERELRDGPDASAAIAQLGGGAPVPTPPASLE